MARKHVEQCRPILMFFMCFLFAMSPFEVAHAKRGIYKFLASNGKNYTGKSVDMDRRINEHVRSGKLKKGDINTVKKEEYNVSNKSLLGIEKAKIKVSDILTKGGVANKQHAPLSRKRAKIQEKIQKIKNKVQEFKIKSAERKAGKSNVM